MELTLRIENQGELVKNGVKIQKSVEKLIYPKFSI